MLINNFYKKYLVATLSYGLIRKGIQMRDATISHYDRRKNETIRIPVLLSDKVMVTGLSGIVSVYLWPIYMYNDLRKLEIDIKNVRHDWYYDSTDKYLSDYIFS